MRLPVSSAALILLSALLPPQAAHAADFGLGTNLLADDANIAIPIRLKSLLLEPEVMWGYGSGESRTLIGAGPDSDQESTTFKFGFGVYRLGSLFSAKGYFGARVAYLTSSSETRSSSGSVLETEQTGWSLAPVVGIEYFLSKDFVVAVDSGLEYLSSTDEVRTGTTAGGPTDATREERQNTRLFARLLVRGYF